MGTRRAAKVRTANLTLTAKLRDIAKLPLAISAADNCTIQYQFQKNPSRPTLTTLGSYQVTGPTIRKSVTFRPRPVRVSSKSKHRASHIIPQIIFENEQLLGRTIPLKVPTKYSRLLTESKLTSLIKKAIRANYRLILGLDGRACRLNKQAISCPLVHSHSVARLMRIICKIFRA